QLARANGRSTNLTSVELSYYCLLRNRLLTNPILGTLDSAHTAMTSGDDDKHDPTLRDPLGWPEELRDPVRRRAWLLAKALQSQPLDRALELARSAEGFIIGAAADEDPGTQIPGGAREAGESME